MPVLRLIIDCENAFRASRGNDANYAVWFPTGMESVASAAAGRVNMSPD
jgi:hypothetical protein